MQQSPTKTLVDETVVVRRIQKILSTFKFPEAKSFGEEFAQKRYWKKMEVPDESRAQVRKEATWSQWLENDARGVEPALKPSNWYKARLICHKALRGFRLGDLAFSNGSEFTATGGHGSIEAKLSRSDWSCTPNCWDLWAETAYEYRGLRHATRMRFRARVEHATKLTGRQLQDWLQCFHNESWRLFSDLPIKERREACFRRMLRFVTTVADGSRFSTVRKNNEIDRPIELQRLLNMLVQRRIGLGLRESIQRHFGIDLRTLANHHRERIRDEFHSIATIDLKNASDSVWLWLTGFMVSSEVFQLITGSRSYEVLYGTESVTPLKTSSMGNGFTFELMSLILLCIARVHDQGATVFGDDIIIDWTKAYSLIRDLKGVGLQVNENKTFIHGNFRESCGGNYHWKEGYIESYDFEYPLTLSACATSVSKVRLLSLKYDSFKVLYDVLHKAVPRSLRGTDLISHVPVLPGEPVETGVPQWFSTGGVLQRPVDRYVLRYCQLLQLDSRGAKYFTSWVWESKLATKTTTCLQNSRHWAKILMYQLSGRSVDDAMVRVGKWRKVCLIEVDGRVVQLSSIRKAVQVELIQSSMINA